MGGHHTADTCFKYFFKGIQFKRIQLRHCFIDNRQVVMRINAYIAMTGKMFGAGHYAHILHALHVLCAKQGHFIFVFPKAPVIYYRVIGVVIDINNRCIVNLDACTPALFRYHLSILVSNTGISHSAQHHLMR